MTDTSMSAAESPKAETAAGRQFLKYTTFATGKAVLENRTLRWSTPSTLNDPYDAQFDLHVDIDREQLKATALRKLWEAYSGGEPVPIGNALGVALRLLRQHAPSMAKADFEQHFIGAITEGIERGERYLPKLQADLRPHIAKTKVLCLTMGPEPNRTLMWSHYADGHRGLALRFRSVPEADSVYKVTQPVGYRADMPRLLDAEFLSDMMSGRVRMDVETTMHRLIFTKSKEWEYEQEWRILTGFGRNPDAPHEDCPFHPLELDAVILGCRMPEENRKTISEITRNRYPQAHLLQINKADRDFRFEIAFYAG